MMNNQGVPTMDKCAEIQEKINLLAFETFKEHKGFDYFSMPLIPRISPQYLENRFVLLGQETNTWNGYLNQIDHATKENLSKILLEGSYDYFCNHKAEKYRGAFWNFSRSLYKNGILPGPMVNPESRQLSHCWMNLFCIEKCTRNNSAGRPSQHPWLAEKILKKQDKLVFNIFEQIKPKIILATTGHKNDNYLKEYALNVSDGELDVFSIDPENIFGAREVAEFKVNNPEHSLYGTTIIRCYHPTFFTRQINRTSVLKEAKRKLEEKNIHMSKAAYYQHLIFRRLSNV